MHAHLAVRLRVCPRRGVVLDHLECLILDVPDRPYQDQDAKTPHTTDVSAWLRDDPALVEYIVVFRARVARCSLANDESMSVIVETPQSLSPGSDRPALLCQLLSGIDALKPAMLAVALSS
jgi:hypothetical protein